MIPFYLVMDENAADRPTPEQILARQMGTPPFRVHMVERKRRICSWIRELETSPWIGLIYDPEFWYSPDCWNDWVRHVEKDLSGTDIFVPLGGQNPAWRSGLDIPCYATLRQLEIASSHAAEPGWKTETARNPDDFTTLVVSRSLLEAVPKNLTLEELPSYWVGTCQTIRIFCGGWLHPFSSVRQEGRRDDLISMCSWKGRVLELGCGEGRMAANCRQRGFDVKWVGVDINPAVLKAGRRRMDLAIQADIRSDLPFNSNCLFDRIVCGDVLEHLPYPWEFLTRIRNHIQPDGLLVASFPNIGHWSVIEDLLAGRWDETPSGIFCVSHLRFGTRKTWDRWFRQAGWQIRQWESERLPIPQTWAGMLDRVPVPCQPDELETIRYRVLAISDTEKNRDG
jgi:SAM-dependent methyltransferase